MRKPLKLFLMMALVASLLIATALTVSAAEDVDACTGDAVTGTVVAVDEGNVLTVWDGTSLCTVDLGGEFDPTVPSLLGVYFDGISFDVLNGALMPSTWDLVYDEVAGTWALPAEGDASTQVTVAGVADNGDGTYTITFFSGDDSVPQTVVIDDAELAAALMAGLDGLGLDLGLTVDENGIATLGTYSGLVEQLHDDGMGYGVMVKLFSVAQSNDVDVQALIDAFNSGMGLGEIYETYGYPELHGVGHVFQGLDTNPGSDNSNGHGNGNGWGKPADKPDHPSNNGQGHGKKP